MFDGCYCFGNFYVLVAVGVLVTADILVAAMFWWLLVFLIDC